MKFKVKSSYSHKVAPITPEELYQLRDAMGVVAGFGFEISYDERSNKNKTFALIFPLAGNEEVFHDYINTNVELNDRNWHDNREHDWEEDFKTTFGCTIEEVRFIVIGVDATEDLVNDIEYWDHSGGGRSRHSFQSPLMIRNGSSLGFCSDGKTIDLGNVEVSKNYELVNMAAMYLCDHHFTPVTRCTRDE